jgi:hypothetical protein
MFGLFKKKEGKTKIDAAEFERQEREQRDTELAQKLQDDVQAEKLTASK